MNRLPFKPDWGRFPDKLAAALHNARRRNRYYETLVVLGDTAIVLDDGSRKLKVTKTKGKK